MQKEGRMLTCDRCGTSEFFRKKSNCLVDTNGGLKTRPEYESSEKWGRKEIDGIFYDFCPACNEQYMRMVIDFAKPLNSFTEKD